MRSAICILTLALLTSCNMLKTNALFDAPASKPEPPHISNFYGLNILTDNITSEVWFTENPKCITVQNSSEVRFSGKGAIHLKWDKQEGGCDWIGLGVGWDGWSSKDLSPILDKAAIQIKAHSKTGKVTSLPLAASLEDYSGLQAWIGMAPKYIKHDDNEDWATVTLPLSDFGWDQFEADASNIKQLIIQFEASGDVYFDEIKVVPYEGLVAKRYTSAYVSNDIITIDGVPSESVWKTTTPVVINESQIQLLSDSKYLYISGTIEDNTPLLNNKRDGEVWNGDGLEIALSTNRDANPKRTSFLYSDQHFALGLSTDPMIWDMRKKRQIQNADIKTTKVSDNRYSFEARIPFSYLEVNGFDNGETYDLEVAINKGNGKERITQERWNNEANGDFYKNPSLWGKLVFIEIEKRN
ncbi:MAG: hypothetical protein JJ975_12930 [Bacteroidia bacterium]|nr:hypothetical protein [Bacteroidia bacterium]